MILQKLAMGFLGLILLLSCSGKSTAQNINGTSAIKNSILEEYSRIQAGVFAKDGIISWEKNVTETDSEKAPGWIARGKTNIKVIGPITEQQLLLIGKTIKDIAPSKNLIRLDLSQTRGLKFIPKECFGFGYDRHPIASISSIVLPEGITKIEMMAFEENVFLSDFNLPDTLELIDSHAFLNTSFIKLVIPPNVELNDRDQLIFSSIFPYLLVFKTGREDINLGDYKTKSKREIDGKGLTLVLPASIKKIFGRSNDKFEEIYCYSTTPPILEPKEPGYYYSKEPTGSDTLGNKIKAIYVPQGSEKVYEEAWFNYTSAEFKPIPSSLSSYDSWY
jgi:hypothetical protein